MAAPELVQLWQDPRHWTAIGIYHCQADPRVIVPKRWRWGGWTLNFAHSSAWFVLIGSIAILAGPVVFVAAMGRLTVAALLAILAPSILLVCLAAAWESERRR